MKHCKYCANTNTHLDKFGYCKKYDCFGRSGERDVLNRFIERCGDIYFQSEGGQVSGPVSNFYNGRTRFANNIMSDAERHFGFLPEEILERIPMKHREKWDKNIRW